ncbi:CheR family methyltransferase [Sulfuriferula thiophila]|uniref:CheR family methyltransferase n=1 Tax=Sulfuriferula thiophila TaxID=1781211 RepID=UPI000F610EBA|nr:CheR family methyltransferase [Sulfuriferula thiophila]
MALAGKEHVATKEFIFTARDFSLVRELIYQRAGISLSGNKQDMVYSRLARRLRAVGVDTFTKYLSALQQDPDSEEWEAFTNALTTNLTSFFRESHHFPILANFVKTRQSEINIWCSASSTGEEPYSIAMTACEAFGTLTPPVSIIATDIDTNVLEVAATGVYTADRLDKMSPERIRRFFLKGKGSNEGTVRVRKELRDLITFKQLNLLSAQWPVSGPFDVVFCRNVMIYFDKPTQAKILNRFAPLMKHDGLLFAGHSENFLNITDTFSLLSKTVYELNNQSAKSKS